MSLTILAYGAVIVFIIWAVYLAVVPPEDDDYDD